MANVIFYKSPINISETVNFKSDSKNIIGILRDLNIHNEALAIRINGKSPDEVDLLQEVNEKDLVEIARMVHGNSYGSKRTLAGVLQFAAIAAAFIPGIGTAVSIGIQIGLNLAAGYLNAKAARIKAGEATSIQQEEVEIESNSTSPINASNEVRVGQPMMIIMGSIRVAPDVHQLPLKSFAGGASIPVTTDFYDDSQTVFNFGIGDISIGVRRIQKILLTQFEPSFRSLDIQKDADWAFDISEPLWYPLYVWKEVPGSDLRNENGATSSNIGYTDQGKYNFVRYDGPINFNLVRGTMKGRCYYASNTGMQNNGGSGEFEIQYRRSDGSTWQDRTVITVQNNNTKDVYLGINYGGIVQDPEQSTQIRIRKKTADSSDNSGQRVMEFRVDSMFFGREVLGPERYGLNLVGLEMNGAQKLNVSDPKFSALCSGRCWVWDPVNEEWDWTFTRNPAWWFKYFANGVFLNENDQPNAGYPDSPTYWITTNPTNPDNIERIFGAALTDDQIDLEAIKEWAQFCDDNEIYFDYVLKDNISCAEMLERIANIGRAYVTYSKGILGVVWEESDQTPVGMYGMGNIIAGSFSVQYNVADSISKVIGKYIDRDRDWEQFEVAADVPYANSENFNYLEIVLDGITTEQQAQREVNILAARQYYQRRVYSWKVDHEGLIAKRGDVVYLSHDATQYGYSGRIKKFNVSGSTVISIETTSLLEDSTINYVTVRAPDGTMATYECSVSGNTITFIDSYPIAKAPVYIDAETDNNLSDYADSMPDDFIFISSSKETPGKRVRITEIKVDQDFTFSISAMDDDPAMWSYEFNDLYMTDPEPESFDDSEIVCKVDNLQYFNLGNGLVKIMWENLNSDFIKVINANTELPIEADGSYSFSGGEVILELEPGHKYTLRIEPFVVGTAYRTESRTITLWA